MNLYPYQEKAVDHILKHSRSALFLDCGLGKTAITITAMRELPKPILVLAPKRVIQHTWPTELEKWWPEACYQSLSAPPKERNVNYRKPADIYLLNFELFAKMFGKDGELQWKFGSTIIDESTKVKNRGSQLFKALRYNLNRMGRVVELTGTPSPNGLEDLWAQIYLLDGGARLGKTLTAFRERWFKQGFNQWDRTPYPHSQKEIEHRISDLCLSMSADDYLDLPDMMVQDIAVDLPNMKDYRQLQKDFIAEIDGKEIVATTAAVLANKLLQFTSGSLYNEDGDIVYSNEAKLMALEDLIDNLAGEPLLIVYQFRSELEKLRERFYVEELRDNSDTVDRWNQRKIPLLAIHPASAGHGINLQHGGNHIVWTTPTYNLEHYIQTNARLHRNGQTKPVIVHRLIAENTIDRLVVSKMETKATIQSLLLEALKC